MRWNNFYWQMNEPFLGFIALPLFGAFMLMLFLWSIYWKGRGLWRAARKGDFWWFIAMLVINTLGILEIFYLFVFSKKNSSGADISEAKES